MPTLVALKPHRYAGRLWRKGQTFEASPDDALVLRALNVAADAVDTRTVDVTTFADETPRFETVPTAPVKRPRGRPRKSTYSTRAMVAETPTQSPEPVSDDEPSED